MKKLTALFLSLSLLFSAAGCAGGAPTSNMPAADGILIPDVTLPEERTPDLDHQTLAPDVFYLDWSAHPGAIFTWIDYGSLDHETFWSDAFYLELSAFSGATFSWDAAKVTVADQSGERVLFGGMPVWNVFLTDITGDGLPDFAATVSMGSGIVDTHVLVYDYANGTLYPLGDRTVYDYSLSIGNETLVVTQTPWAREANYTGEDDLVGKLAIIDGELTMVTR